MAKFQTRWTVKSLGSIDKFKISDECLFCEFNLYADFILDFISLCDDKSAHILVLFKAPGSEIFIDLHSIRYIDQGIFLT